MGAVQTAVADHERGSRRSAREAAVVVPRMPVALVLHQVFTAYRAVVHEAAHRSGYGGRVVERPEGVELHVEVTLLQARPYLVGKTRPEAHNAGGVVYAERHLRRQDGGCQVGHHGS